MSYEWSADKLSKLTDAELLNLKQNAASQSHELLVKLCELEFINRRKHRGTERSFRPRFNSKKALRKTIENEADESLVTLARDLSLTFDLSPSTAKRLSSIPIRALTLLSKSGDASKIGGVKKRGEAQIYRYISYRISSYEVSLAAVMVSADEDRVSWRIDGSDELVTEKTQRYCGLEISYGMWFDDFEPAAKKFRELIAIIAPPATT